MNLWHKKKGPKDPLFQTNLNLSTKNNYALLFLIHLKAFTFQLTIVLPPAAKFWSISFANFLDVANFSSCSFASTLIASSF